MVESDNPKIWKNGKPDNFENKNSDQGLEIGNGDGTVVFTGATLDSSISNKISTAEHMQLPNIEEENIFNILTNKTIQNGVHRNIIVKMLTIQLKSPIDVLVVAPDGKKIGKNFETGGEYAEIEGAFYSGFDTDEEYITIPNPLDGEYKIQLQGTGDGGEFGVVTNYISDNSSVSKEYTDTIKPNEIKETSVITNNIENILSLEIRTKEVEPVSIVATSKSSGSSSGSSRRITGEVLGASTDNQIALQLKLIEYLKQLINLYQLLLKII